MMSQLPSENQSAPMATLTSHAMLVTWGIFAQCIGLVETLESVPIPPTATRMKAKRHEKPDQRSSPRTPSFRFPA